MNIDRQAQENSLATFGVESQIDHVIEEMGELIVAIMEMKRANPEKKGRVSAVINEIADVYIMIDQAAIIFGEGAVQTNINKKLQLLTKRIESYENKQNHSSEIIAESK